MGELSLRLTVCRGDVPPNRLHEPPLEELRPQG